MPGTTLVAVGAIACDIILGVPSFPDEDSKLRATSFHKRRGGNVGNALEVLHQLVRSNANVERDGKEASSAVDLVLVAALPSRTSSSIDFIASSFADEKKTGHDESQPLGETIQRSECPVNMQHCLYRDQHNEPVTSYIISSAASQSRTIINHNPMPEMTFVEFSAVVDSLIGSPSGGPSHARSENFWFHFEGRIPETTLQCMSYLRELADSKTSCEKDESHVRLTISVEIEKPGREGLQDLAREADVVLYSRSWAEGEGYSNAADCLRQQAKLLMTSAPASPRLLICTWGADGADGLFLYHQPSKQAEELSQNVIHSPAHKSDGDIVDSTGAGDTFIAAVLHQLMQEDLRSGRLTESARAMRLRTVLDLANALASQKIRQHGFSNLRNAVAHSDAAQNGAGMP